MPTKRVCSCKIHDSSPGFVKGTVENLEICKKYSKIVISFLIEEGNLTPRATLLCRICSENACIRFGHKDEESQVFKRAKIPKYFVDEFIYLINIKMC